MKTYQSTVGMTRGEWLEARRSGIGGSDAPALILPPDIYKWSRPADVYASKVEPPVEEEAPLACRVGTYCEPLVAELFCEQTGLKVRCKNSIIRDTDYPFMLANIDRKIAGANIGLECKTTSQYNAKKFTDDGYPPNYYVQVQHYLAVTGWEKWFLAVLIGNSQFRVYEIERNEGDIAEIIETERRFWEIVKNRDVKELESWE